MDRLPGRYFGKSRFINIIQKIALFKERNHSVIQLTPGRNGSLFRRSAFFRVRPMGIVELLRFPITFEIVTGIEPDMRFGKLEGGLRVVCYQFERAPGFYPPLGIDV